MTKPIISITEDELNEFLYDGETPETDFNEDDFYSSLDGIEVPGVDTTVDVDNTVTDDFGDIENVDTRPHGAGLKRYEKMDRSVANSIILSEVKSALDDLLGFIRPTGVNVGL